MYWLNLGVLGAALGSLVAGVALGGRRGLKGGGCSLALCWIWPIVLSFQLRAGREPLA